MKRKRWLIRSLAAAGLIMPGFGMAAAPTRDTDLEPEHGSLLKIVAQKAVIKTAQHRSHQSHSSHRSSSSGSKRSVPTYTPPPRSNSTPPASILPDSSSSSRTTTSEDFTRIAKRVQQGLKAYGYYNGEVDGMVGTDTKAALSKFQADYDIKVTGTITPDVLEALGIS